MSPLRLLLEGPDLPTLLEQIRTEYGAEARIVQAEKVRSGGVAGFFARERFNIQVEVPRVQVPPRRAPKRGGSPVQSVMDLVDLLNLEDKALHQDILDAPRAASRTHATEVPGVDSADRFAGPSVASASLASPPQVSVSGPSAGSPAQL